MAESLMIKISCCCNEHSQSKKALAVLQWDTLSNKAPFDSEQKNAHCQITKSHAATQLICPEANTASGGPNMHS